MLQTCRCWRWQPRSQSQQHDPAALSMLQTGSSKATAAADILSCELLSLTGSSLAALIKLWLMPFQLKGDIWVNWQPVNSQHCSGGLSTDVPNEILPLRATTRAAGTQATAPTISESAPIALLRANVKTSSVLCSSNASAAYFG